MFHNTKELFLGLKVKKMNEKFPIEYVIIRATAGKKHRDNFFTSTGEKLKKYHFLRGRIIILDQMKILRYRQKIL